MAKGSTHGKDPAVSFFFNDWNGGTSIFTRHLKGCYIDLLTAQFNNGHLTLNAIKNVLNVDFETAWPELQVKFKQDKDGLYYNERLDIEIQKRLDYSKSRSKNKKGKPKSYDGTYDLHMGIGIGIGYEKVFNTWLEYKAEKNQKYKTEKSLKACYENLVELSGGDPVLAEKIVNQSMANNWAGLFKLKSQPEVVLTESIDSIANQLKAC